MRTISKGKLNKKIKAIRISQDDFKSIKMGCFNKTNQKFLFFSDFLNMGTYHMNAFPKMRSCGEIICPTAGIDGISVAYLYR